MRSSISYINSLIFRLLPEGRCFGFKRAMLRLAGASVGRNVRISSSVRILGSGQLVIGDNTWIGYDTMIVTSSSVTIGANVDIAPRVYIGTGTHTIDADCDRVAATDISRDIVIGDGCWICANATILPGVSVADKCVVAAGAVLHGNTQPRTIVGGVPAVVIKNL